MNTIIKKIAYLKGLSEGLGIAKESNEGKILVGILDVLDSMADVIISENIQDFCCECEEDEVDEAEYSYAFICPNCGQELEVDEEILKNEMELNCPACGNIIPIIDEFASFDDEEN